MASVLLASAAVAQQPKDHSTPARSATAPARLGTAPARPAKTQPAPVHFTALTSRDGLSQSTVNCIFRDSYGFLWFGTQDGLNRYDGYSFTIYRHDAANPRSIADNQIKSIIEDDQHRLWIGTLGGGLCIYDRDHDDFLRLEDLGIHPAFHTDPAILSLLKARDGSIWIGTFRGLLEINAARTTIREFQPDPADTASLSNATIQALFQDHTGRIWIGTYGGLDVYWPKEQKFTRWQRNNSGLTSDHLTAITQYRNGSLYLATDGGGLNVFDPVTGTITSYLPAANPDAISSLNLRSLCPAPDGTIWVGTENGLDRFDPVTKTFSHHRHTLIGEGSLTNNTVISLLEDSTGTLWAGTAQGGVNKYDRNLFYFDVYRSTADAASLSGDQVTCFAQDPQGNTWIGTDGAGLNRWSAATGRFDHYYPRPGNANAPSGTAILSLLMLRDKHTLCIGTYGNGLDRLDLNTGRFTHLKAGPGPRELSDPSIYAILEDYRGNIWMGTNGGGVDVLHPDGTIDKHTFSGRKDSVSNNYIRCLLETHDGSIWIGTYSGGISVYDSATKSFTVYDNVVNHLSNQVVFSLCEDTQGRIWAGTMGGGLDLFNPATKQFRVYNEASGLSNNIVNSIIEDTQGFLWLSTNKGISRFNPATGEFRNFGIPHGLQSLEFLNGSGFMDSKHRIFFGGISGFNVFDPTQNTVNKVAPQPRLTDLYLFNTPVRPGVPGSPLKEDINRQQEIVLSHDQYDFSIGFAAAGYTIPADNKFAYTLQGFDKNWNFAGPQRRATYTNLSPGHYSFHLKAANNDGVWSTHDTVIGITVLPPFWKTWWAYTLYALIVLAILYLIYRDITIRERLRGRIRLEQMTAEKNRELNELKLHFFTNVSHELRTPLSLITDPLRKLIKGEISPDETRRYGKLMYDNATRLTRLIDQMLDWRKLETGHLRLDPRNTDLVGLTKDIAGLFTLHATERHLAYTISAPETEINAIVDTDKFEKIVFNLISNAFKYTPDGGSILITIRHATIGAKPAAELHVRDTGIGIAPGLRDKVFDLFYQVQGSRRYESASSGIGLALARQLAELQGGTLTVTSEEGAGSDFILTLPLNGQAQHPASPEPLPTGREHTGAFDQTPLAVDPQTPPAAQPQIAPATQAQPATPSPQDPDADLEGDTPLILLVEDNAHLRDYIRGELPPTYRTATAGDGATGLDKALQLIPDLIISDVMMPHLSGLELCRAVKTDLRTSHIPVILLTARQSDAHQVEGYSAGADVYIPKPFNMEVITACVSSLLESRRKMHELYRQNKLSNAPAETSAPEDHPIPQWNFLDRQFLENTAAVVDHHLADPLFDVEVLATKLKVSRRQLYRKLNALIGETPHDYITTRRLTKAAQLLLTGELTVSEVAYKTGFTDAANFSRSFTRHYGQSPSKYRKEPR
ncbi:MAG TPA: two-component regulator propeller domain-containing protein [Puia sp.]|nr:two-component regulator propeller domain-containing protein [Puia sp.]